LVLLWLLFAGGQLAVDGAAGRDTVESYFMVNSASFFVGWAWVVTLRDLAAISGQVAVSRPDSMVDSVASVFGLQSAEAVRHAETMSFVRALAGVFLLGPVLSVVVVQLKGAALRAYGDVGGTGVKQRLQDMMEHAGTPLTTMHRIVNTEAERQGGGSMDSQQAAPAPTLPSAKTSYAA
jgi:hypothetical protein